MGGRGGSGSGLGTGGFALSLRNGGGGGGIPSSEVWRCRVVGGGGGGEGGEAPLLFGLGFRVWFGVKGLRCGI